jgi:hypothetical protein
MAVVQGLTSVGKRPGLCTSALTKLLLPALTCPTTAIRRATRSSSRRESSMSGTPRSGTGDNISRPQAASSRRKTSSSEQTIRGVAGWISGPSLVVADESTATAASDACKVARLHKISAGFDTASPLPWTCTFPLAAPPSHLAAHETSRLPREMPSSRSPATQNCDRPRATRRISPPAKAGSSMVLAQRRMIIEPTCQCAASATDDIALFRERLVIAFPRVREM